MSSRICCHPSERTICSTPASSTAAEGQRDRSVASTASGSDAAATSALAAIAPGSRLAGQMIRASGAGGPGASGRESVVQGGRGSVVDGHGGGGNCTKKKKQ